LNDGRRQVVDNNNISLLVKKYDQMSKTMEEIKPNKKGRKIKEDTTQIINDVQKRKWVRRGGDIQIDGSNIV
jgi:hypothetical protein